MTNNSAGLLLKETKTDEHEIHNSGLTPVGQYVVAISGASGAIYGIRLLKALLAMPVAVHAMITRAGRMVAEHELGYTGEPFERFLRQQGVSFHPQATLTDYHADDLFAPSASGSYQHQGMVVAPCSMKTLGAIASGISDNLIPRSADVALKEKRPLILVIRETPFNLIHIKNMHTLALAGATLLPASPSFYHHPQTIEDLIDTVVARVLDQLGINHHFPRWRQD